MINLTRWRLGLGGALFLFCFAAQGQGLPGQYLDPKQKLLAQLKDVKAPDAMGGGAIGWWPPAPGWWILAVLVLLGVISLVIFIRQREKKLRYRKIALATLENITCDNPQHTVKEVMHLLKRVYFSAYSETRGDIASLYGLQFLSLLQQISPQTSINPALAQAVTQLIYGAPEQDPDEQRTAAAFKSFAKQWIIAHPAASRKTRAKITLLLRQSAENGDERADQALEAAHV